MQYSKHLVVTFFAFVLTMSGIESAQAQCALPYTIANGQPADATKLMANFNALVGCLNSAGPTNAIQYNANGASGSLGPLTNGQVIIGATGGAPQAATITPGTGIAVTNSPGKITIAGTGTATTGLYHQMTSGTPTSASTGLTNWLNQGSSTATDGAVGFSIDSATTGGTTFLTGRYAQAPAAPYTITALVASTDYADYAGVGLGWYDGTAKLHVMELFGGSAYFVVQKWNSVSSGAGADYTGNPNYFAQPIWLRLQDDGTNVSFAFSQDGANFLTIYTVAKSSGFLGASGYSNIFFFVDVRFGRKIGTILSWTQS